MRSDMGVSTLYANIYDNLLYKVISKMHTNVLSFLDKNEYSKICSIYATVTFRSCPPLETQQEILRVYANNTKFITQYTEYTKLLNWSTDIKWYLSYIDLHAKTDQDVLYALPERVWKYLPDAFPTTLIDCTDSTFRIDEYYNIIDQMQMYNLLMEQCT